jgi:trimethylguanosine synthase
MSYQVLTKITVIHSNFLKVSQKADVIFASPPWGGPTYINSKKFNFANITPSFSQILQKCSKLSNNFIIYLPKNLDPFDLLEEIQKSGIKTQKIELQVFSIGKNIKGIGCFFGDIVRPNSEDTEKLIGFNNG